MLLLFSQRSIVSDCSNFAPQDKETGSASVSPPAPDLSCFLHSQNLQPRGSAAGSEPPLPPPRPKDSRQSARKGCHINTQEKTKQGAYLEVKDGYSLLLSPASALSEQASPPPGSLFTSALKAAMLRFVSLPHCDGCGVPFSPFPPCAP